ncbi:MAG TPA: division/cell wall cluster transcriptional repressor MraZ [Candidatus Marinimicrobia bacterium]|nr:division/cell wall cluster transcriptional repressor MraZ [Candidatus Neomarinimicrobiota bacterium]HIN01767.1 division/cell wall cluster transcriptional repressor MraZ [Candidatus Neomarinimicrobiota bacterium]
MTLTNNTFIGEYAYSLDSKGRVNVPAKFRQSLSEDNENTFVITRGVDPCIWVYPLSHWKEIESNLRNLSSISKIHRTFVRNTARYASPSTYDKQGRITLTPSLIEYADLDKDALIIGMINKMEIWNPDRLDETDQQNMEIDPAAYDDLADKIIL